MTIDWQAIRNEMRSLSVHSVAFLGEGWTSRAYLVNQDLVFRFPRRDAVWLQLELEMEFLSEAKLPLRVPQYHHASPASRGAPHGYAVCTYVPGDPIAPHAMSPSERDAAADSIAGFLKALHRIDPTGVDAPLPRQAERQSAIELLKRAEAEVLPQLRSGQRTRLLEQFTRYIEDAANFAFPAVVRHADFSVDHILALDNSVAGVIDFSDVSVGDGDYDFSYLFLDAGEAFTLDVARRYGHPNLDLLRTKLGFFAVADLIDTIVNGDGLAPSGAREMAWSRLHE